MVFSGLWWLCPTSFKRFGFRTWSSIPWKTNPVRCHNGCGSSYFYSSYVHLAKFIVVATRFLSQSQFSCGLSLQPSCASQILRLDRPRKRMKAPDLPGIKCLLPRTVEIVWTHFEASVTTWSLSFTALGLFNITGVLPLDLSMIYFIPRFISFQELSEKIAEVLKPFKSRWAPHAEE